MRSMIAIFAFIAASLQMFSEEGPDLRSLRGNYVMRRAEIERIQGFLNSRKEDIFSEKEGGMPSREEKEILWNSWKSLIDSYCHLDVMMGAMPNVAIPSLSEEGRESFAIYYSVFLAEYRLALDFIALVENNPVLHKVLNDSVPELGIPARTYHDFKLRFLNPAIATRFVALDTLCTLNRIERSKFEKMGSDRDAIIEAGLGKGIELTAQNAIKVLADESLAAVFPLQSSISEWMGDTKVHRIDSTLISADQMDGLKSILSPGDIILERREWYLSNIGLPGYWPHAALYVGTPEQRRSSFAGDKATADWVRSQGEDGGDFEMLLQRRFPGAYKAGLAKESGHQVSIIEAMSEGVVFTSVEHSASCDSLAVLRPRLPKVEKARAVFNAMHLHGRPYDFDFDFLTDSSIVCTELVYKSYEPCEGFKGMNFPLVDIAGRKVTPANEMARQFDEEADKDSRQSDIVIFLDASEGDGKAFKSTEKEFRRSWRRPKWHIVLPAPNAGSD